MDLTTTTRVARVQPSDQRRGNPRIFNSWFVYVVPIADTLARYVVQLVRSTRHNSGSAPDFVKKYVNYGASVRAAQFIVLASKARALTRRRYHVATEDIVAMTIPVLRHRILLNFHAESDRIESDEILRRLLEHVPQPTGALT